MKHLFFICCTIGLARHTFAQPFPPPPGWQYVRSFDSVEVVTLHVRGDTVSLIVNDQRAKHPVYYFSTNGGASWDSNTFRYHVDGPNGFLPRSNTFWYWTLDGVLVFVKTSDGGKTYTTYRTDSLTNYHLSPDFRGTFINPFDANDLVVVTQSGSGTDEYDAVYRSRDGGRTWSNMPITSGPGAIGVLFDQRQQGRWYVRNQGITYRTTDNGENFEAIGSNWGAYCGISKPGVFRNWWTTDSYITYVGFVDLADDKVNDSPDSLYWMAKLDSIKPQYNQQTGYYHALGDYSFDESSPDTAVLDVQTLQWDPSTGKYSTADAYIAYTTNDGLTWTRIWESQYFTLAPAIDENTNTMWAVSGDDPPRIRFQNYLPMFSIWKRDLRTAIEPPGTFTALSDLEISTWPNPVVDRMAIRYALARPRRLKVSICDVLGRTIRSTNVANPSTGEHQLIWNLPRDIPAGTYLLRVNFDGSEKIHPFAVVK